MQLDQVSGGELAQDALATFGQRDADESAVTGIGTPLDQARRLRAVHKLDRAVMPQQQTGGEIADGRQLVTGMPLDRDQELVLNMSEPGRASVILAPALKTTQAAAEPSKCSKSTRVG